jgi:phospholipid transport system substrate-binding protein
MQGLRRGAAAAAAALFVCVGGLSPAAAVEADTARAYVDQCFKTAVSTFSVDMPKDKRRAELRAFIDRWGDLGLTGQDILGRYWGRTNEDERARFRATLGEYLLATWGADIDTVPSDVVLDVGAAEPKGERLVVHSVASRPGDAPGNVDWYIGDRADGTPFVADINFGGVSLGNTMREDFGAVLRSNGGKIDVLLDVMRKKMAEAKAK